MIIIWVIIISLTILGFFTTLEIISSMGDDDES